MVYTALEVRRRVLAATGRTLSRHQRALRQAARRALIAAELARQPVVFTLEDHVLAGGFGAAVLEFARGARPPRCQSPGAAGPARSLHRSRPAQRATRRRRPRPRPRRASASAPGSRQCARPHPFASYTPEPRITRMTRIGTLRSVSSCDPWFSPFREQRRRERCPQPGSVPWVAVRILPASRSAPRRRLMRGRVDLHTAAPVPARCARAGPQWSATGR